MPIPFKLDYVIERTLNEPAGSEKRALKKAAGVRLTTTEARAVWSQIQEHKWYLSERLGRDVGLRVAAVDYFENVKSPQALRSMRGSKDGLPPRLRMMQPLFS